MAQVTPGRAASLLKRVQGEKPVVPTEGMTQPEAKVALEPPKQVEAKLPEAKVEYDLNPKAPVDPALPTAEQKKAIPKEYLPEDPTDEIDSLIDPADTTGANFKKLRTKLKSLNGDHRKANEELTVLRQKVADYDNGLAVPEVTQLQLDRIAQLEVYEKLYNFKGSPVYQEKIAKPLGENREKLQELAKQDEVDDELLTRAFAAETDAETNRILSQGFKDPLSAIEAKGLIKSIKGIQAQAIELEKEPMQSLARMQQENDRIVQEKRAKANDVIVHVSKEAWSDSLIELRKDPRFPEITYREGDSEHNEKFVRPILTKAGQEYGRIIRTLAECGMTELPKDLSMAFARMTQLAHQSAAIAFERDALRTRVGELESLMQRKSHLNRPGINGNVGASSATKVGVSEAVGPQNAGRKVLDRVMTR